VPGKVLFEWVIAVSGLSSNVGHAPGASGIAVLGG
jgi:hypothetical protein